MKYSRAVRSLVWIFPLALLIAVSQAGCATVGEPTTASDQDTSQATPFERVIGLLLYGLTFGTYSFFSQSSYDQAR